MKNSSVDINTEIITLLLSEQTSDDLFLWEFTLKHPGLTKVEVWDRRQMLNSFAMKRNMIHNELQHCWFFTKLHQQDFKPHAFFLKRSQTPLLDEVSGSAEEKYNMTENLA